MREITTHKASPDDKLRLVASEVLGPGGAPHMYGWTLEENRFNLAIQEAIDWIARDVFANGALVFQHGGVPENGVNGLTVELLLAICADRLTAFQAGPYPSPFNERALAAIIIALETLHCRTAERQARGVEGRATP